MPNPFQKYPKGRNEASPDGQVAPSKTPHALKSSDGDINEDAGAEGGIPMAFNPVTRNRAGAFQGQAAPESDASGWEIPGAVPKAKS